MGFKPGHKLAKGRPVGSLNRSTEMMKLSVARATNSVLDNLTSDLEKIRKSDPEAAINIALKLLEFSMPKLSRTEMKADINQRIEQITVNVTQKILDNESGD
jgi:hypothetical protein